MTRSPNANSARRPPKKREPREEQKSPRPKADRPAELILAPNKSTSTPLTPYHQGDQTQQPDHQTHYEPEQGFALWTNVLGKIRRLVGRTRYGITAHQARSAGNRRDCPASG